MVFQVRFLSSHGLLYTSYEAFEFLILADDKHLTMGSRLLKLAAGVIVRAHCRVMKLAIEAKTAQATRR